MFDCIYFNSAIFITQHFSAQKASTVHIRGYDKWYLALWFYLCKVQSGICISLVDEHGLFICVKVKRGELIYSGPSRLFHIRMIRRSVASTSSGKNKKLVVYNIKNRYNTIDVTGVYVVIDVFWKHESNWNTVKMTTKYILSESGQRDM